MFFHLIPLLESYPEPELNVSYDIYMTYLNTFYMFIHPSVFRFVNKL